MGKRLGASSSRRVVVAGVVALIVAAVALLPYLPQGADIYVHLVWTHQVMRCLAQGDLPVWCPDLNAGFGSPGIRLYSPGGPVLSGAMGLVLGDAGRGLRLALVASVVLIAFLGRRRGAPWPVLTALVIAAPVVAADLLSRGAWSQVLAVPLAWWLLEEAIAPAGGSRPRWRARALALACLWLIHAPTTLMVGGLVAVAIVSRPDLRAIGRWALAALAAAALTAWHWLPLLDEMALVGSRADLVEGIFVAADNFLGNQHAHAPELNLALSAAAISLVLCAALAVSWSRERRRLLLILASVVLASPLAAWLWRPGSPLEWLQFPWRLLLPATLLAVGPVAAEVARRRLRGLLLAGLWLLPLLALPYAGMARVPAVGTAAGWHEVGEVVARALGANPLLVDAAQNRPQWYAGLATSLPRFGPDRYVVGPDLEEVRVVRWDPLHREVEVRLPTAGRTDLRLLWYPWWEVKLDGEVVAAGERNGVVSVPTAAGTHLLSARWRGNPLSRVGLALAAGGLLMLIWRGRAGLGTTPRREREQDGPSDAGDREG